jgi:midasin (ATPase involved in ribosome maturation)
MTLLSGATAPALEALLACHILKGLRPSDLHRAPSKPAGEQILFEQYWVEAGPAALPDEDTPDEFVLTPSVRHHLSMLARAVLLRKHPILLQVRCARSVLPQSARLAMMQNIPRTENAGTSSDVCGLFDV